MPELWPPVPPAAWLCPHCPPEKPRAFVGLPAIIRHARRQHKELWASGLRPSPRRGTGGRRDG